MAKAGAATDKAASGTPSASSTGAASTRKPGDVLLVGQREPAAPDLLQSHEQGIEARQCGRRQLATRCRLEQLDLGLARQMRQHRLADRGRVGGHAAADPNVDAKAHEACLNPFDIDEIGAVRHGDRSRLDRIIDELAQHGTRELAQVGAGDRVEAEIETLQRQPESLRFGKLLDVAELHQRVEEAKRSGVVDAGGARHFRKPHFDAFGRERFQHAKTLRERLNRILVRGRCHGIRARFESSDSEL